MSVKPKIPPTILVTSAGGKTGAHVVADLLTRGFAVRAFLHRQDHRAKALANAGAEVFVGDMLDLRDMKAAMAGCQRAYHCAPTAPNGLFFSTVFAEAAAEARFEHIVTLSQWLSSPTHPSQFTREVWLATEMLRRLPGTLTEVNVGWFADNYFMVLEMAAQLGLLPMPLGDGAEPKNAPPSNEDIAAVVAAALAAPEDHADATYRPTGPSLLTPDQIAEAMGRALGRNVAYRDMSERMFLKAIAALQPPGFAGSTMTQLLLYTREYRRGAFAVGGATDAVERVTGRAPEDFASIARRMASRPEAQRSIARRLGAARKFGKILLTPTPDVERILAQLEYPMLRAPEYCDESAAWRGSRIAGTSQLAA